MSDIGGPPLDPDPAPAGPEEPRQNADAARRAIRQLDRDLRRIERKKRKRIAAPILWAFAVIFFVAPALWVAVYGLVEAPGTVLMLKRDMEGQSVRRDPVPLAAISPHLVRAVIASEDTRFCRHDGFDLEAIDAARKANDSASAKARGRVRGASTLSQQTAKNLFLWPARSWLRKGLEVYFTGMMEFAWPKTRILEAYLNAAEFGGGLFGAEAAAQGLFFKSAKDLTAEEAARLAAILPSPNKWNAVDPGPGVRARAATIMARMRIVRREGLDLCVLDADAPAPPPARGRRPPPDAPPMPDMPTITVDAEDLAEAPPPPPPEFGYAPSADPSGQGVEYTPPPGEAATANATGSGVPPEPDLNPADAQP